MMPSEKYLLEKVISFEFAKIPVWDRSITIERRSKKEGVFRWAVCKDGFCFAKDNLWEWEMLPSSRDDKFLDRTRYDSLEEAWSAAGIALELEMAELENVKETHIKIKEKIESLL